MLRVDVQNSPSAVTLVCSGRIVLGVEVETLRCIAGSHRERHVVLDMRQVHGIDASGLGLLVELHCSAQERCGSLRIANVSPRAHRPIALTRLDQVLQLSSTPCSEDRAVDECRAMTA